MKVIRSLPQLCLAHISTFPTREMNKILPIEMHVLRWSARKSRMEKIKNEHTKEIMGVKGKPDVIDIIEKKRLQWYGHVKRMPENTKINYGMDIAGEKEKRTSNKNVDGRSTSSHNNKKFRTRSRNREEWRLVSGRRRQLVKKPDR